MTYGSVYRGATSGWRAVDTANPTATTRINIKARIDSPPTRKGLRTCWDGGVVVGDGTDGRAKSDTEDIGFSSCPFCVSACAVRRANARCATAWCGSRANTRSRQVRRCAVVSTAAARYNHACAFSGSCWITCASNPRASVLCPALRAITACSNVLLVFIESLRSDFLGS